jgi:SAM-dependent methyltransferase
MIERRKWLRTLRKENERQEDLLSPVFDERWGEVDDLHRTYVAAFLSRLPGTGVVLDAACGTGKYFQMVLDTGLTLLGVDHSSGHLTRARQKFPHVSTEKHDLQELPYRQVFDGVMCIDAMEFVPPEDWPMVVARFRSWSPAASTNTEPANEYNGENIFVMGSTHAEVAGVEAYWSCMDAQAAALKRQGWQPEQVFLSSDLACQRPDSLSDQQALAEWIRRWEAA